MSKLVYETVESCKDLSHVELGLIYDIAVKTVYEWIKIGLPQNEGGNHNLIEVIKWREDQVKKTRGDNARQSEELRKLEFQNKKLEIDIANLEKKTMLKEDVLEISKKQATELRLFLTDGYKKNALELWANYRKCETLQDFLRESDKFIKAAMDAFVASGKDLE